MNWLFFIFFLLSMVIPHQVKGSRAAKIHMAKVRAIKASGGSLASNWVAKLAAHKKTGQQNWKGRTPHGVFDISRVRNPSKHLRDNYGREEDIQHDEQQQMSDLTDSDSEPRQTYFGQPLSRREKLDIRFHGLNKNLKALHAEGKRLGVVDPDQVYDEEIQQFDFPPNVNLDSFRSRAQKEWLKRFRAADAALAELTRIKDALDEEEQRDHISDREEPEQHEDEQQQEADHHDMHDYNSDDERGGPTRAARRPAREARVRRPRATTARAARLNAVVVRAPAERRRRRSEEAPAVKLTKAQAKARHHAAAVTLADKVRRQVRL
jgi:hypothetical protein